MYAVEEIRQSDGFEKTASVFGSINTTTIGKYCKRVFEYLSKMLSEARAASSKIPRRVPQMAQDRVQSSSSSFLGGNIDYEDTTRCFVENVSMLLLSTSSYATGCS